MANTRRYLWPVVAAWGWWTAWQWYREATKYEGADPGPIGTVCEG